MTADFSRLQQFRRELYACLLKRRDAIFNVLDSLSSFAHQCQSVVQLSKAPCFDRQYTSLTDAIADGLPAADWQAIGKLVYAAVHPSPHSPPRFLLDVTHQARPYAKKLLDKTLVHAPNPTPGNKPIALGHAYAVVAQLPQDALSLTAHWVMPLAVKRVQSTEKGHEVGMQQVIEIVQQLGLSDKLSLSIGDSLYGTETCRRTALQEANLVHLLRLNSKRNVFSPPEKLQRSAKGRQQEFGTKMVLSDERTHPPCTQQLEMPWPSRQGKTGKVVINGWKDRLLRGSRQFRSSKHPINLVQITVLDEAGNRLFKRPLWLAVFGKCRHEVSLDVCYSSYRARYDIEHFFRFGKTKLLLDAYQTPDVSHEESWWQLVMLAYAQLYLARESVTQCPEPWERYLPQFQQPQPKVVTPTQTQRGFQKVLAEIGSPTAACKPRGKPRGRATGESALKREDSPVIFKGQATASEAKAISLRLEETAANSNPKKITELLYLVTATLKQLNISPETFVKTLLNTS